MRFLYISLTTILLVGMVSPATAATTGDVHYDNCWSDTSNLPTTGAESPHPTVNVSLSPRTNGTVVANYTIPKGERFYVEMPSQYRILTVRGFEKRNTNQYVTLGHNDTVSIVYQALIVNRVYHGREPSILENADRYHSSGSETVVSEIPKHRGAKFNVELPEGGHIGNKIMALGEIAETRTLNEGCHTVEVIRPASTAKKPYEETVADIDASMTGLDLGRAYNHSIIIVHPQGEDGFAHNSDAVVGGEWLQVEARRTLPVHEYIHTRQSIRLNEDMRWFREASATYLSARFLYEAERISTAEYDQYLAILSKEDHPQNATLAKPGTWGENTDYAKGGLFLASLDRELRESTNGSTTMFDIAKSMNGAPYRYTVSGFDSELKRNGLETPENQSSIEAYGDGPVPYEQGQPRFFPELVFDAQLKFGIGFLEAHIVVALYFIVPVATWGYVIIQRRNDESDS